MSQRHFTLMIIPDKGGTPRRLLIPGWLFRGSIAGGILLAILSGIMLLDYGFIMGQLKENQDLKTENRRLRQQVQVYRARMNTIEGTLDRVKTFATRLRVITNLEDRGSLIQSIKTGQFKIPDSATNLGTAPALAENKSTSEPPSETTANLARNPGEPSASKGTGPQAKVAPEVPGAQGVMQAIEREAGALIEKVASGKDPAELALERDLTELSSQFGTLETESGDIELQLQDLYELLADKKSFLAALPTRKPASGYFTSGFGIRKSPYGGYDKMHEGLDIANFPGTTIVATADGQVSFADTKAGYGQTVVIDHGYGLETWYGHTRRLLVRRGQKVRRGEQIALLGNSGRSTGPHVHYEVRVNGTPVDPLPYILEN